MTRLLHPYLPLGVVLFAITSHLQHASRKKNCKYVFTLRAHQVVYNLQFLVCAPTGFAKFLPTDIPYPRIGAVGSKAFLSRA